MDSQKSPRVLSNSGFELSSGATECSVVMRPLGVLKHSRVSNSKTGEQRFNDNDNQHKGNSKAMIVFEI